MLELEAAPAPAASTSAGEGTVVVRLPVVACQLLPGLYPAQRVEFDATPRPPHERVRLARMVDVPEVAARVRGVECRPVFELDDHDAVRAARTSPRLALRDAFTAEFAQLPPRAEGQEREEAAPVNPAPADFEVERVQAGDYSRSQRRHPRRMGRFSRGRHPTTASTRPPTRRLSCTSIVRGGG